MAKSPPNHPAGTLFVVATPIGNLKDITLRAIETLNRVDLIAAEDTRRTRKLLNAHGIEGRLIAYHEHNEQHRTQELVDRLKQGESIALVSDAGTPMISDPGYRMVQAAADKQIQIVPIPGVSAAITALSASGLATDSFTFVGFPARKKNKRLNHFKALADLPHTLIFYQSPRRVLQLMEELGAIMGDRPAVLARELTKLHEEFIHGSLMEIRSKLEQRAGIKGECTLLVAGAQAPQHSEADMDAAIHTALSAPNAGSLSDIAKTLAKQFNASRRTVYEKALKLRRSEDDQTTLNE